jgi:hypothetical protein
LLVLAEIFPRRIVDGLFARSQQGLRTRIGEEEELAAIEAENFGEPRNDLVRGVTFAGLEVSDIRGGGLDPMRDLVLGQVELATTVADNLTECTILCLSHTLQLLLLRVPPEPDGSPRHACTIR